MQTKFFATQPECYDSKKLFVFILYGHVIGEQLPTGRRSVGD